MPPEEAANMKTLAIIPAYNEERNIGAVASVAKSLFPGIEILVVNDGSSDNTGKVASAAGAIVAAHPFNMGYGVSLQTGYKYAVKHGYDFIVQLDADGQHDPKYISDLLAQVRDDSADFVLGSRFTLAVKYDAPFARRIGMLLFGKLVSFIIGQKITDSTSGFQAMNSKVARFFTEDLYPCDYPDADVIILLHKAGFRIKEVGLVMYEKHDHKSMHSGLKPFYYIFKMTLSIFVTLLRKRPRPER